MSRRDICTPYLYLLTSIPLDWGSFYQIWRNLISSFTYCSFFFIWIIINWMRWKWWLFPQMIEAEITERTFVFLFEKIQARFLIHLIFPKKLYFYSTFYCQWLNFFTREILYHFSKYFFFAFKLIKVGWNKVFLKFHFKWYYYCLFFLFCGNFASENSGDGYDDYFPRWTKLKLLSYYFSLFEKFKPEIWSFSTIMQIVNTLVITVWVYVNHLLYVFWYIATIICFRNLTHF